MSGSANPAIEAAAAAWQRLKRSERSTFDDWLIIGRALVIGRAETIKAAKTNRPIGTTYNRLMGQWLRNSGLDDINTQERYRLLLVIENLPAIMAWRETLPPDRRRAWNHPNAIWSHWQRATKQRQQVTNIAKPAERHGRKYYGPRPSQDRIRCVATALREHWTADLYVLAAAVCLAMDAFDRGQEAPPAKPAAPRRIDHSADNLVSA